MQTKIFPLIAAALLAPAPAQAKEGPPVSLPRVSKWEMRYDEDSCKLVARFGEGERQVITVLSRERPGDGFGLELYGKPLYYGGGRAPMEITFGSAPPMKRDGLAMTMSSGEKLPVIKIDGLRVDGWAGWGNGEKAPKITPEIEAAATTIAFTKNGGQRYVLETGGMDKPMAAMRACTDDLLRHWGFDPEVEASLSRRAYPTGNPANWAGPSDYPNKAMVEGNSGLVQFRLDVGTDGMPYGCRILYRTDPDDFADLTCQLLKRRARFKPALDAAGNPVKSYYISRMLWVSGGSSW